MITSSTQLQVRNYIERGDYADFMRMQREEGQLLLQIRKKFDYKRKMKTKSQIWVFKNRVTRCLYFMRWLLLSYRYTQGTRALNHIMLVLVFTVSVVIFSLKYFIFIHYFKKALHSLVLLNVKSSLEQRFFASADVITLFFPFPFAEIAYLLMGLIYVNVIIFSFI